jgi:hypothetical protein
VPAWRIERALTLSNSAAWSWVTGKTGKFAALSEMGKQKKPDGVSELKSQKRSLPAADPGDVTKLKAQAEYVVWRDGVVVPSRKAGSTGVKGRRRVSALKADLPAADPGDVIAHRWRKRLCMRDAAGRTVIDKEKIRSSKAAAWP